MPNTKSARRITAERYRISNRHEEADCNYCGCPLFVGDIAFAADNAVYCSKKCIGDHRDFTAERQADRATETQS